MEEHVLHVGTAVGASDGYHCSLSDKAVSKAADAELDLSARQGRLADSLVKLLQPFESTTRLLSGEAYI